MTSSSKSSIDKPYPQICKLFVSPLIYERLQMLKMINWIKVDPALLKISSSTFSFRKNIFSWKNTSSNHTVKHTRINKFFSTGQKVVKMFEKACLMLIATVSSFVAETIQCPNRCECHTNDRNRFWSVFCRGKALTKIPKGIPANTNILILDNNPIGSIKEKDFSNLPNLYRFTHNIMTLL